MIQHVQNIGMYQRFLHSQVAGHGEVRDRVAQGSDVDGVAVKGERSTGGHELGELDGRRRRVTHGAGGGDRGRAGPDCGVELHRRLSPGERPRDVLELVAVLVEEMSSVGLEVDGCAVVIVVEEREPREAHAVSLDRSRIGL